MDTYLGIVKISTMKICFCDIYVQISDDLNVEVYAQKVVLLMTTIKSLIGKVSCIPGVFFIFIDTGNRANLAIKMMCINIGY